MFQVNVTVLITYGGGSAKRSSLIDKIKTALGNKKNYEFGGIEPDVRTVKREKLTWNKVT